MAEFMKAMLKHFDFTTPKDPQITPRDDKKDKERRARRIEKIDSGGKKKKTDIPFYFHTVYFGVSGEKKMLDFCNTDFKNPDIGII